MTDHRPAVDVMAADGVTRAVALVLPGVTMLSLVIVFSAYALVDGVLAIVAAVRSARRHER